MGFEIDLSPDKVLEEFRALKTRKDLAKLLGITDRQLRYNIYICPSPYKKDEIPKKSGNLRIIHTPIPSLKIIQRRLNQILCCLYKAKPSTHGFTPGKSIITNAKAHIQQQCILNLDLEDFFSSINFGRVRGLFIAKPYECTEEIATVIAQICCYKNRLPQGAPTSPIISNMICARLDSNLQKLAKKYQCVYTRYADDITFSTSRSKMSHKLAYFLDGTGQLTIGHELKTVISANGFSINISKTRIRFKCSRQEVTGITVNEKLNVKRKYIRQIRAMLHAWEKYGFDAAQEEYIRRYNQKNVLKPSKKHNQDKRIFERVVRNKIDFVGHVRGRDDSIYLNLLYKLSKLNPTLVKDSQLSPLREGSVSSKQVDSYLTCRIFTEGKTDVKHLKAAFRALTAQKAFENLNLDFVDDVPSEQQGDKNLLKRCEMLCSVSHREPIIAVFDRDDSKIVAQCHDESIGFKVWGNGVYSFAIPVPEHRSKTNQNEICIEMYYSDSEIKTQDLNGRRLYLNTEFDARSSRHKENSDLSTTFGKLKSNQLKIIDDGVFDNTNSNVAMTKNDFADNVLNQAPGYENFDFDTFKEIFDVICKIRLHYHMQFASPQ